MTSVSRYPGWSYAHMHDMEGLHELHFSFNGEPCGHARVVVFEAGPGHDAMRLLSQHADVMGIFDELETWLQAHPGRYVWLDSVVRSSSHPQVKGQLTSVLHECLSHQALGLVTAHEALAFPCPYGLEDEAGSVALTRWYERMLGAHQVPETRLIRFALSDDLGIMGFDLSTFEPLDAPYSERFDEASAGSRRRFSKRPTKQRFVSPDEVAEVCDAPGRAHATGRWQTRVGYSRSRFRE